MTTKQQKIAGHIWALALVAHTEDDGDEYDVVRQNAREWAEANLKKFGLTKREVLDELDAIKIAERCL